MSEPGAVAFDAYRTAINGATDAGVPVGTWEEQRGAVVEAFRTAAEAVQRTEPPPEPAP